MLAAAVAVVEVVLAQHLAVVVAQALVLPAQAHLEVVVAKAPVRLLLFRAHLPLLQVVPLVLPVRASLVLVALLRAVVALAELVVEGRLQLHLLSRQSFSAAMASSTR
jgi:hypothetical protein